MIIAWIFIFIVSLLILVKGADWLILGAERIGLAAGLPPFVIGITIVGIGTSLPELISSLVAINQGVNEVVVANAVGSNIANILLVVGFSAVVGKGLSVSKSLITSALPFLAFSAVLFLWIVFDGKVTFSESLVVLVMYSVYILHALFRKDNFYTEEVAALAVKNKVNAKETITFKDYIMIILGSIALTVGAHYLIESIIAVSEIIKIGTGVIAITAVALGTSLPELLVSVKAALSNKSEVALGNIFGSNVFNSLALIGVPGLFGVLTIDDLTLSFGVPTMIVATILLIISSISKKIHIWEGLLYLSVYLFFIIKLFSIF